MATLDIGSEGFFWFLGVVEDRNDPLHLGRVRVRIHNHHTDKKSFISTENLPWATIMGSPTSASLGQVGSSPTGIAVGSTVIGFFMDGADKNQPVIMGTLAGIPGNDNNKHDVPAEARGINSINKEYANGEPQSAYRSKYPYNKVIKSESGHVIELDDTPDAERIHVYHKSGAYVEIDPSGRVVVKSTGDMYQMVNGNYTLQVGGNIKINGSQVNINNGSKGAARVGDTADTGDDPPGVSGSDGSNKIETGSKTVFIGD